MDINPLLALRLSIETGGGQFHLLSMVLVFYKVEVYERIPLMWNLHFTRVVPVKHGTVGS